MNEMGRVVLSITSMLFQSLFIIIGLVSYSDSRRRIDKIRFTFLTLGSVFTLIFVVNEVFAYV
ncbi:hypothetical protein [Clostridium sp.]|uniref:hypothetical protein n=1 Tax=Clostridium sp. TaxID=1506 RepID=UPI001D6B84A4|nr:hypothetical protein [Clostridium sp.]MBS5986013.1 hypothetical protein [Clostridium sp.]